MPTNRAKSALKTPNTGVDMCKEKLRCICATVPNLQYRVPRQWVSILNMSVFNAAYVGALHVGDEIVEICGISVQGRTVDFLQKMLASTCVLLF